MQEKLENNETSVFFFLVVVPLLLLFLNDFRLLYIMHSMMVNVFLCSSSALSLILTKNEE